MQSQIVAGLHVGIVMDGNGRWAAVQGLPRSHGHRAGVEAIRRVVGAAPGMGIGTLTLFGFSCGNWQRPGDEVSSLLGLVEEFVRGEAGSLAGKHVRMSAIGRRDRLPASLSQAIADAEALTRDGKRLHLRVALDYSGREEILRAANEAIAGATADGFARRVAGDAIADVDLIIRTGGEQRLSDFLLWESAYAELYFTDRCWPDFDAGDLREALLNFAVRERRFGAVTGARTPLAAMAD